MQPSASTVQMAVGAVVTIACEKDSLASSARSDRRIERATVTARTSVIAARRAAMIVAR